LEAPKPQAKPVQPEKTEAKQVEQAKPAEQTKPAATTKPTEQVKPIEQSKPNEQVKPVVHVKPNTTTPSAAGGNVSPSPNMFQGASTNVTPTISPAANTNMQPLNAPSGPSYGMAAFPYPNVGAAGGVNPALTAASILTYMPNLPVYPNPMLTAQQTANPSPVANINANIKAQATNQPIPLPIPEAAQDPYRYYEPFVGPYDPCPPITVKRYVVPINQYLNFQPPGLPQFAPAEALRRGTLWPLLSSPYEPEY